MCFINPSSHSSDGQIPVSREAVGININIGLKHARVMDSISHENENECHISDHVSGIITTHWERSDLLTRGSVLVSSELITNHLLLQLASLAPSFVQR